MLRSRLGTVGLVVVVLGAVLLVSPTLGFGTIAAERGANVDTTTDPQALLGVVDNSASGDADVTPPDREGAVFYLQDNAGEFSATDISADVLSFDGQPTDLEANVVGPSGGYDAALVVTCGSSNQNAEQPLTVSIDADNGDVSVSMERTTDAPVQVNCRGGGGGGAGGFTTTTASSIFSSGGPVSQTFTFEPDSQLSPQAQVEIDLSDAQADVVDYSGASVSSVSGGTGNSGDATFTDDETIIYTPQGSVGSEISITVEGVEIQNGGIGYPPATFIRSATGGTAQDWFLAFDSSGWGFSTTQSTGTQATNSDSVVVTEEDVQTMAQRYDDLSAEDVRQIVEQNDDAVLASGR